MTAKCMNSGTMIVGTTARIADLRCAFSIIVGRLRGSSLWRPLLALALLAGPVQALAQLQDRPLRVIVSTPPGAAILKADHERWAPVIKASGFVADD